MLIWRVIKGSFTPSRNGGKSEKDFFKSDKHQRKYSLVEIKADLHQAKAQEGVNIFFDRNQLPFQPIVDPEFFMGGGYWGGGGGLRWLVEYCANQKATRVRKEFFYESGYWR